MILGTTYVQNTDVTSIAAKIKEGSSTFGLGGHHIVTIIYKVMSSSRKGDKSLYWPAALGQYYDIALGQY